MSSFSLGTIWEQTIAFIRREAGLLIPVALAIYGPAQMLLNMGVAGLLATPEGKTPPLETLLIIPGALLLLLGNLVIALIVLTPGISVAEALSAASRRLGHATAAMLILFGIVVAIVLAIGAAATVGTLVFGGDPGSPGQASQLRALAAIPVLVIWVRMLLLPSVLAYEGKAPKGALRRAWQLSRANGLRLAGVALLTFILGMIVALIEQLVVGSVVELAKLALGQEQLVSLAQSLINAALEALLAMAVAVYLALLYRAIASA